VQAKVKLALPTAQTVKSVTLWVPNIPQAGVLVPNQPLIETSTDGSTWTTASVSYAQDSTTRPGVIAQKITLATAATGVTWIRTTIQGNHPNSNWHLLSEISVSPS